MYRVSTEEILKHKVPWPRADGAEIVGLDPDLVPLLEVNEPQPPFDSATETVERSAPVVDVDANTHTHGWTVRALTAEELQARADQQQHNNNAEQARQVYQALRDGDGNSSQRIQRLERVCAHLLKRAYYDEISGV
jgi:hypothetical protein